MPLGRDLSEWEWPLETMLLAKIEDVIMHGTIVLTYTTDDATPIESSSGTVLHIASLPTNYNFTLILCNKLIVFITDLSSMDKINGKSNSLV